METFGAILETLQKRKCVVFFRKNKIAYTGGVMRYINIGFTVYVISYTVCRVPYSLQIITV